MDSESVHLRKESKAEDCAPYICEAFLQSLVSIAVKTVKDYLRQMEQSPSVESRQLCTTIETCQKWHCKSLGKNILFYKHYWDNQPPTEMKGKIAALSQAISQNQ